MNRRELLQLVGTGSLLRFLPGCGNDPAPIDIPPDATFDDVLDLIHLNDVEFGGGLSNHAPMAAEALVALGLADRVVPWVASYAAALPPFVEEAPLPASDRVLGDAEQRFAWIAAYLQETASPAELVARDWGMLAPGYAAIHGVLRVAHALRSLEREDTPARRRELAFAMGYFAADYFELPGQPGASPQTGLDVVAALATVPLVPEDERVGGLILEQFGVLAGRPEFVAAIEAVDLDALPIEEAIGELCAASARLSVHHGGSSITYLHAVTGTSALRLVLPYLDPDVARATLGYAFQHVAASYAVSANGPGVPDVVTAPTVTEVGLVERAARTDDEHGIKLTEACLREFAITGKPELLAAAQYSASL